MIPGGDLSGAATLADPNGIAWRVRLNHCAEHIWLCDGLKEFIEYYKIHYASIVQFTYQGNSSFRVCIFDAWDPRLTTPAMIQSVMTSIMKAREIMIQVMMRLFEILDTETPIPGSIVKNEEDTSDGESLEVFDTKPPAFCGSYKGKFSSIRHLEQQHSLKKEQIFFPPQTRGRPPKHSRDGASVARRATSTRELAVEKKRRHIT